MAETVGSIIDKLSIIGLKIWHMQEQVERPDATPEFRAACARKVAILKVQSRDLQEELSELAAGVLGGTRKMKVYYQMKMYNDPKYRIPTAK
jgi:hypothetical protein